MRPFTLTPCVLHDRTAESQVREGSYLMSHPKNPLQRRTRMKHLTSLFLLTFSDKGIPELIYPQDIYFTRYYTRRLWSGAPRID